MFRSFIDGPAPDIRIEFEPTGGVGIDAEVLEVRTDEQGRFELSALALDAGVVEGELRFFFRDSIQVGTEEVQFSTTPAAGDTRFLGRFWIPYPHFASVGQVYNRATGSAVEGASVEFRRTGGIPIEPETYSTETDSFGNFLLAPAAEAEGEVIGILTVTANGFTRVVDDLRIATVTNPNPRPSAGRFGLGPHLPFIGQALWADTGFPATGVVVEVKRISGIQIEPESYSDVANEWGGFNLGPVPLSAGTVDLEITFRPPAPAAPTVVRYSMETLQEDAPPQLIERWTVQR